MCGIIGIIAREDVAPHLVSALKRLEYRGYDSAGIATLTNGQITRCRAEGKITNLEKRLEKTPLNGVIGIGHTRWATHGAPNETNAHPHATDRVALVHNGIIENFMELRRELEGKGHRFETETDSEVVVQLITFYLTEGLAPRQAVSRVLERLTGAFALAIIFAGEHDLMIGARLGSPLAVGYGQDAMYLGSDALALAPFTQRLSYLEEGDMCEITGAGVTMWDRDGREVTREIKLTANSGAAAGRGNYPHFMLKEIYEQPAVIGDTLNALIDPHNRTIHLPDLPFDFRDISRLTMVACGTSFYAALTARYWFEQLARLPVEVEIASEFRYREAPMDARGLALFISQSGETADTLAALRYARTQGQVVGAVVNVPESSMAREADFLLQTYAGPEIGVASTKAFTTQLTVLACLAIGAGLARGTLTAERAQALTAALIEVPARAADVLNHDERLKALAEEIKDHRDVLYLGRGTGFPIALEGALKLKEISYIHAEGYAAGEMKHGPIALIDDGVPVIVIAPSDPLFEKTASNMHEVVARGGRVIFLSDADGVARLGQDHITAIALPAVDPLVAPILYAIPVQLLAYHVAVAKGTDVDQPRNLAKSVTVE
ncbi:MAG: glutamine--fructose-6-phosphate transaminase (isomerizing) [Alphaproteobacteria bacterium]